VARRFVARHPRSVENVTRPIRVLELRSVRGTGGGPEKTILFGAARSDPARVSVTVCYIRDTRDDIFAIGDRARALGVDYVEVLERGSFDPRIWPQLRRLIAERSIDIIHGHDYKTDLLTWLLAKRTGRVALSTVHGWAGLTPREQRIYYPANKRLLARFSRVIAVSNRIREELLRYGADPARVSVVLNSIDPARYRRDEARVAPARRALALGPTDVALVTVGRLEAVKRFDLLIQAFAVAHRARSECRLFIAGDGSERQALEAERDKHGLGECCVFLGHTADPTDLYHAADLFVQSADSEGTPNAVLEAMAFEVPVVATDAGGTREVLRDGVDGIIVPTGKVDTLTGAIQTVLEHPAEARIRAKAARARVETELAFETRMRRVEAIYEELVGPQA
jgi:glycosyltransferase involved in cell wall biosynthesis